MYIPGCQRRVNIPFGLGSTSPATTERSTPHGSLSMRFPLYPTRTEDRKCHFGETFIPRMKFIPAE